MLQKLSIFILLVFLFSCSSDDDLTDAIQEIEFELSEIYSISKNRAFAKIESNNSNAIFEIRMQQSEDSDSSSEFIFQASEDAINLLCDLEASTVYEAKIWAIIEDREVEGNTITFETDFLGVDDFTEVIEVQNPITGRTWMDRNLGAQQVANSMNDSRAYGHLYQWGRRADGHQFRDAEVLEEQASSVQPEHGSFLVGFPTWNNQQNTALWKGVDAKNNPCPCDFRLPTPEELAEEIDSWSSADAEGALASPLKFSLPGYRGNADGIIASEGEFGYYWSAESESMNGKDMGINTFSAQVTSHLQGGGASVRCIKDK